MKYIEPLFRPPAEADSLIFQVAYGCPHNHCTFCAMYKSVRHQLRERGEVLSEIADAGRRFPQIRRVFLADGDVMALPFERLREYLEALCMAFPRLARVNVYANGSSIAGKTDDQLRLLRELRLQTLYVGLESGSQEVLDLFNKTESVETMIAEVLRAQTFGFKCSVMLLIGLAGNALRDVHIRNSVTALNRMRPALLSALRFIPVPGFPLPPGYQPVSEFDAVEELRAILLGLDLPRTVFRANHSSNPIPLAGRFPADKTRLLAELDDDLSSGRLDRNGLGNLSF